MGVEVEEGPERHEKIVEPAGQAQDVWEEIHRAQHIEDAKKEQEPGRQISDHALDPLLFLKDALVPDRPTWNADLQGSPSPQA